MSTFTLVYTRVAEVYPSDDVNIPFPNVVKAGSASDVGAYLLIDDTVDFVAIGIKVGDTVFNASTQLYALVTAVATNELTLSLDIFLTTDDYVIYQGVNNGCYIYIPTTETGQILQVETIGGDNVYIFDPPAGVFPLQVKKVLTSTTYTGSRLLAMW
jgi:hypothetical protein